MGYKRRGGDAIIFDEEVARFLLDAIICDEGGECNLVWRFGV